jgi:hypothetical protein
MMSVVMPLLLLAQQQVAWSSASTDRFTDEHRAEASSTDEHHHFTPANKYYHRTTGAAAADASWRGGGPLTNNCQSCTCDYNRDPACPQGFDSCVCPGEFGVGWQEPKIHQSPDCLHLHGWHDSENGAVCPLNRSCHFPFLLTGLVF